tara:strand:- start:853 stop:1026 length:174 start_codon:yes stop_codon:yes gene_type:complete
MASYRVKSARVAGKNAGDIVHTKELQGVDVEALIAGGHLELATTVRAKSESKEQDTE